MKSVSAAILAALLPGTVSADTSAPPVTEAITAMGAYVATDDMEGSETFYRALFDSAPVIGLPDFVAFNVAGGWFAIVSRERYAPGSEAGTGSVPYLQSSDLETHQARIAAHSGEAPRIIGEPGIRLLKITDPNGQLIEFFSLTDQ